MMMQQDDLLYVANSNNIPSSGLIQHQPPGVSMDLNHHHHLHHHQLPQGYPSSFYASSSPSTGSLPATRSVSRSSESVWIPRWCRWMDPCPDPVTTMGRSHFGSAPDGYMRRPLSSSIPRAVLVTQTVDRDDMGSVGRESYWTWYGLDRNFWSAHTHSLHIKNSAGWWGKRRRRRKKNDFKINLNARPRFLLCDAYRSHPWRMFWWWRSQREEEEKEALVVSCNHTFWSFPSPER